MTYTKENVIKVCEALLDSHSRTKLIDNNNTYEMICSICKHKRKNKGLSHNINCPVLIAEKLLKECEA